MSVRRADAGLPPRVLLAEQRFLIMPFSPIPDVLEDLKLGKPIVLVDDEDRENEGDIVYAAEKVTPEAINFMVKNARGVVCLALTPEVCDRLHLHSQLE